MSIIQNINIGEDVIKREPSNYIAAGSQEAYKYFCDQLEKPRGDDNTQSAIYLNRMQLPVVITEALEKNQILIASESGNQVFEIALDKLEQHKVTND